MRSLYCIPLALLLACAASLPAQAPQSAQKDDPAALWQLIKSGLLGPDKDFFEERVRDVLIPDTEGGFDSFPGTVVASQPEDGPDTLVVGFADSATPEITLRLDRDGKPAHLTKPVPPGTKVAFQGVARAFTREPFMLTFVVGLDRRDGIGHLSILDAGK